MAKFKVIQRKKECISCGACVAIAPDYWEMDDEGMAQLKGGKETEEGIWELDINTEEAKATNQEAADVCPVGIIDIEE